VKVTGIARLGIICGTILASLYLLSVTVLCIQVPVRKTIPIPSIPQTFVLSSKDTEQVSIINARLGSNYEVTGEVMNNTEYSICNVQVLITVRLKEGDLLAKRRDDLSCKVEPGTSKRFLLRLDPIEHMEDVSQWDWYWDVEEVQVYKVE
jgi:hypothetical protein